MTVTVRFGETVIEAEYHSEVTLEKILRETNLISELLQKIDNHPAVKVHGIRYSENERAMLQKYYKCVSQGTAFQVDDWNNPDDIHDDRTYELTYREFPEREIISWYKNSVFQGNLPTIITHGDVLGQTIIGTMRAAGFKVVSNSSCDDADLLTHLNEAAQKYQPGDSSYRLIIIHHANNNDFPRLNYTQNINFLPVSEDIVTAPALLKRIAGETSILL